MDCRFEQCRRVSSKIVLGGQLKYGPLHKEGGTAFIHRQTAWQQIMRDVVSKADGLLQRLFFVFALSAMGSLIEP